MALGSDKKIDIMNRRDFELDSWANQMYGTSFSNLTAAQKNEVTKGYDQLQELIWNMDHGKGSNAFAHLGTIKFDDPYETYVNNQKKAQEELNKQAAAGSESARQDVANKQATASAANQANINAGISKSLSGMLGAKTAEDTSIQPQAYATQRGQQVSTQADYLRRMGDVESLELQADNAEKAQKASGIGAFLGGAASGATTGFMLSDEKAKEAPGKSNLPDATLGDAISKLKAVVYKYKENTGLDNDVHCGTVAQSLAREPEFADIVNVNSEGILTLNKAKMLNKMVDMVANIWERVHVLHIQDSK